jgi:hypothetical protein
MVWIIVIAFAAFMFWTAKRGREKAAERAASGQLHSPLHKASNGLMLALLALTFYIGYINHHRVPVPSFLWIIVGVIVVTLLCLRRALKWRYPYV